MPKPIRSAMPTSSVARLLNVSAAAIATSTPNRAYLAAPAAAELPRPEAFPGSMAIVRPSTPSGELAHVKREFVLTPSADAAVLELVELYRRATGTKLTASHVVRALLKGVLSCRDGLKLEAGQLGTMRLPGNARGREGERERFEARIAEAFIAGIQTGPAFNTEKLRQ